MPERQITEGQAESIKHWIDDNGGEEFVDDIDHDVWKVDGELLGIEEVVKHRGWFYLRLNGKEFGGKKSFQLVCSDEHAKKLQQAGIVDFSKEPVQDAQTS